MTETFKIKSRWSDRVVFECDLTEDVAALQYSEQLRFAIRDAVFAGAVFAGADLTGADLTGAVFAGADLTGADFTGAVLRDAVFAGADLRGAVFAGAVLTGAVLTGADLTGADLTGAVLTGAVLTGADLRAADLTGAVLTGAVLTGVPIVQNIDARILDAVETVGDLDMSKWHTCATTHCRAGWAIVLAGKSGQDLETKVGAANAGALIYAASRPGKPIPSFYASNDATLADLRACAAETEGEA